MEYVQTYETNAGFPQYVTATLDEYASTANSELNKSCLVAMEQEVALLDPDLHLPLTFCEDRRFVSLLEIAPAFSHVTFSGKAIPRLYSMENLSDLELYNQIKLVKAMWKKLGENPPLLEIPDFVCAPKSEFNSVFRDIPKAFTEIGVPISHVENLQKASIQD